MKYLILIVYIGILLFIFFAIPDKVIYSQEAIRWTPFVMIFFVQTWLLSHVLKSFKVEGDYTLGICALSVLIIGPLYGWYLGHREETDFKKNGETTIGIVYKKWKRPKKNEWLLRCEYNVDGVVYSTFSETDKDNKYHVGDTLTVIYIDMFPQKCRIKELE